MLDENFTRFIYEALPQPSRVFEIGCGSGDLAQRLAQAGHQMVAIDPDAPTGSIFSRLTLEDFSDTLPFDAVIASRVLHHIPDLRAAVEKIASLLRPAGQLIVSDFAWERFDTAVVEWSTERLGEAVTVAQWRAEHRGLHTSDALLAAFHTAFAETELLWRPYLARERSRADLEDEEGAAIAAGRIPAMGFWYSGQRRPQDRPADRPQSLD